MIFCAEIGSNHKGSMPLAYEMIRQAALAGAHIAKFQFRDPNDEIRGLALHNAAKLKEWCDYWDIEFMASIFLPWGLDVARDIDMKRYKIAHQVWENDLKLTDAIIEDGKETFISCRTKPAGMGRYMGGNARFLWCTKTYPTYPDEVEIPLRFALGWPYGYSSHVHGIADALLAAGRGANYIEKHVTLDKTEESIKDNHFALSFGEFEQMVKLGRQLRVICHSGE